MIIYLVDLLINVFTYYLIQLVMILLIINYFAALLFTISKSQPKNTIINELINTIIVLDTKTKKQNTEYFNKPSYYSSATLNA